MTSLFTPSQFGASATEFVQLAIPAVVMLLIGLALRAMLIQARSPRAVRVRQAASLTIVPLAIVFLAAMSIRVLGVLGLQ
jgi:multisubunit Na+/H+ antiporter MnhB subunit